MDKKTTMDQLYDIYQEVKSEYDSSKYFDLSSHCTIGKSAGESDYLSVNTNISGWYYPEYFYNEYNFTIQVLSVIEAFADKETIKNRIKMDINKAYKQEMRKLDEENKRFTSTMYKLLLEQASVDKDYLQDRMNRSKAEISKIKKRWELKQKIGDGYLSKYGLPFKDI